MTSLDLEGLLRDVGPRLTAVMAGAQDARVLVQWRDAPETVPDEARERLLTAQEFVRVFSDHGEATPVIAAYLRGSWPELDDEAPAVVIRTGDAETRASLLRTVEAVAEREL